VGKHVHRVSVDDGMAATPTLTSERAVGSRVEFSLCRSVPLEPSEAWHRLADWGSHGDWIPFTRVDLDPTDERRFVAWSGLGPVMLEDRMQVLEERFDGTRGYCRVAKLGPVLVGEAEFTVGPGLTPGTSVVEWREDVRMRRLPRWASGFAARVGRTMFARSLGRMARTVR
jgi:hypothetical protein